jgi:hypothetical protein
MAYEEYCVRREEFKKEIMELKTEVENSRIHTEKEMVEELFGDCWVVAAVMNMNIWY